MKPRTKARSVALQVLYEYDLTRHLPGKSLQDRLEDEQLEPGLVEFTNDIVFGVITNTRMLDSFISQHAPEWPLDQVAVIDRNILRIALWEFALSGVTPIKVAINEAIELAKMYGADSTARFVNGVLGSLAIRQEEIHNLFEEHPVDRDSQ